MDKSLLQRAKEWRDLVLLAELGGWLHDLGKLSSGFVQSKTDPAYATLGEAGAPGREGTDPSPPKGKWDHTQVFSDEEPYDGKRVPPLLKQALERTLTGPEGWADRGALGSDALTLERLVAGHQAPWDKLPALPWVQRLLVVADRDDSGEDQYNAVDLYQRKLAQAATVFGREKPLVKGDLTALDKTRLALYPELEKILSAPGDLAARRGQLWGVLQGVMCHGLGKTQRAANDVRLDQHVWGVATRFKAFVMRDLLDPPPDRQEYPRRTFRLLTVRWNWWEVITPVARLSDVVGRSAMLAGLRAALRRLVEDEYALGNRIYEDDNGVHFMVADLDWGDELESLIREEVNRTTDGEVQPVVRLDQPTRRVTDLVTQMDQAAREVPVVGRPAWAAKWGSSSSNGVCPVCQRRPLEGVRDLCQWCRDRRGDGIRSRLDRGTVWTGEIADENGRVALIVVRFGLDRWLDGTMLHTLFITSPQDLAAKPEDGKDESVQVTDWAELRRAISQLPEEFRKPLGVARADEAPGRVPIETKEGTVRQWGTDRQGTPVGRLARWITGRYGRLDHASQVAAELQAPPYQLPPEDGFALALARKNLSASRLLRVWQSTESFLNEQAAALGGLVKERQRVVFTLEAPPRPGIYTAEIPGLGQVDVFVRPESGEAGRKKAQTIEWLEPGVAERLRAVKQVRLVTDEQGHLVDRSVRCAGVELESYLPYQVIAVSPNLHLAMVPADAAVQVAEDLRSAFVGEFGKVLGRLPFHVGLVFMDAHYPMFAALDAGRRLAEAFGSLARELKTAKLVAKEEQGDGFGLTLHSPRFGTWTWHVPSLRGDGEIDWYHPYFLVQEGEDLDGRGMSLRGPEGWWVHVSKLQSGDQIAFWPSLFDFLFLDTVSRRLEAHTAPGGDRRPHPLLGQNCSPRPYPLEGVSGLREVWAAIRSVPGMSESRLAGATSLLARKWADWDLANSDKHRQTWEWLARETAALHFHQNQTVLRALVDGTFFDAVELYRHVLRRKVETARREEVEV